MKLMLLSLMLALPHWHGNTETPEERRARYLTIATAIETAAGDDLNKAAFLLQTAYSETRFAQHVHEDRCRVELGECDRGRAKSLWQLQSYASLPEEKWKTLGGTDLESTTAAAIEAGRAYERARNYCKTELGAIALYGTGNSCVSKNAPKRLQFQRKIRQKLWLARNR